MDSELRWLRRRCEDRLHDLDLPSPFDVNVFCERLAARRSRPILLCPMPMGRDVSGLCVAGPTVDFIFYEEQTAPLHQAQIKLHEACHIVCGHRPIELSEAEVSCLLFPDLRQEIVQRVLQRGSYSTVEEREAEILASLILDRAAGLRFQESKPLDEEAAHVLEKHRAALERQG